MAGGFCSLCPGLLLQGLSDMAPGFPQSKQAESRGGEVERGERERVVGEIERDRDRQGEETERRDRGRRREKEGETTHFMS